MKANFSKILNKVTSYVEAQKNLTFFSCFLFSAYFGCFHNATETAMVYFCRAAFFCILVQFLFRLISKQPQFSIADLRTEIGCSQQYGMAIDATAHLTTLGVLIKCSEPKPV